MESRVTGLGATQTGDGLAVVPLFDGIAGRPKATYGRICIRLTNNSKTAELHVGYNIDPTDADANEHIGPRETRDLDMAEGLVPKVFGAAFRAQEVM